MGGVELLSREGEIAIAKGIEAGKDVMLIALSQSPITAQRFLNGMKNYRRMKFSKRNYWYWHKLYGRWNNRSKRKTKNSGETEKEENVNEEEDDFNPTLAAMESEIKPKVLKTVSVLTKEYNKLIKYQKEKLDCVLNVNFSPAKEKGYDKIVKDILENIKSLQLSPSVLEIWFKNIM